jgi:cytochrome c biogenesis protein CcmG/thiol:disulfide interchange protein DsbE
MRPAAVLILALASACASGRDASRAAPLVGRSGDMVATDLSGREVRVLAEPARARVVDFWATWCEPCREQLPFLDRLARSYRERGLAVYAVAFDEDRDMVGRFLATTPVSFPVLWDRGGDRLGAAYRVERLPTTLVLDAHGDVRAVHLGFDAREGAALEAEVRSLLDQGGAAAAGAPTVK